MALNAWLVGTMLFLSSLNGHQAVQMTIMALWWGSGIFYWPRLLNGPSNPEYQLRNHAMKSFWRRLTLNLKDSGVRLPLRNAKRVAWLLKQAEDARTLRLRALKSCETLLLPP